MKQNRLKAALANGKHTLGSWVSLCSPIGAEVMGMTGFDWLLIDMEHGPGDYQTLLHQLQAIGCAGESTSVVRVQWNDPIVLKRVLDLGAEGVMVPGVRSVAEAKAAISALRYPPQGTRGIAGVRSGGYALSKEYLQHANENICLFLQFETKEAVEEADAILALDGIDVAFIGPNDLAADLGHAGDLDHPEVVAAIGKIEAAANKHNVALGTISGGWDQARQLIEKGYRAVSVLSDLRMMMKASEDVVSSFREHPNVARD